MNDPTPPVGDAAGIPEPTAEDERVLIYLDEMLKDWKNVWSVTAVIRLLAGTRLPGPAAGGGDE